MVESECRSEEDITVGCVDGIITYLRILAGRDLTPHPVREAILDLKEDPDLENLLKAASSENGESHTNLSPCL